MVLAAVVGFWLGEHRSEWLPTRDLLFWLLSPAIAAGMVWRARRAWMLAAAIGAALAFAVGWIAGGGDAHQAFNDCVDRGEQVREALSRYQAVHGRYPAALDELDEKLPGKLWLPPHLLHYTGSTTGYTLYFGDGLVSHHATESEAFTAHK